MQWFGHIINDSIQKSNESLKSNAKWGNHFIWLLVPVVISDSIIGTVENFWHRVTWRLEIQGKQQHHQRYPIFLMKH